MDNRLTFDTAHQKKHPLASVCADAKYCYDAIRHTILSLCFCWQSPAGWQRSYVSCFLYPIQTMQFFLFLPLQGLCQGNKAGLSCACPCFCGAPPLYLREGYNVCITCPLSGYINIVHCMGAHANVGCGAASCVCLAAPSAPTSATR